MKTDQQIAGAILAVTMAAVPARGQVPPPPAGAARYVDGGAGVSLADAIARALDREPTLRGVRIEVDVVRGRRQQAGLRPNPELSFEHRNEPGGTDRLTSAGVQWPLDLRRRQGRVVTAERSIAAAQLNVTDRERLLSADVRLQYGAAAGAVREVQVADDLVVTAQRQLDLVRARVDTGATPPLQADLLAVELQRVQAARLLAAGRADIAMTQLKQLLGMPPEEPLLLGATLEQLVAGSTTAETPTAVATARPDVRVAEAGVAIAEAQIDQARREGGVDITVFGTYMRMDTGFPQLGFDAGGVLERVRGQFTYLAAGAMLTVPLFNRNQGQIAAAQAERSGALARQEAVQLAARAEIASAQARDVRARQAVALYREDIRTLARRNLDVVIETFNLGRASVFDVLTEQRRYFEIEQAYTAALREAWEAHAGLRRALGETP